jgi:hypothetical protein
LKGPNLQLPLEQSDPVSLDLSILGS